MQNKVRTAFFLQINMSKCLIDHDLELFQQVINLNPFIDKYT